MNYANIVKLTKQIINQATNQITCLVPMAERSSSQRKKAKSKPMGKHSKPNASQLSGADGYNSQHSYSRSSMGNAGSNAGNRGGAYSRASRAQADSNHPQSSQMKPLGGEYSRQASSSAYSQIGKKKRRKRRVIKTLVIVVLAVVLGGGALAYGYAGYINGKLGSGIGDRSALDSVLQTNLSSSDPFYNHPIFMVLIAVTVVVSIFSVRANQKEAKIAAEQEKKALENAENQ